MKPFDTWLGEVKARLEAATPGPDEFCNQAAQELGEKFAEVLHNVDDDGHGCWSADKCFNTTVAAFNAGYELKTVVTNNDLSRAIQELETLQSEKANLQNLLRTAAQCVPTKLPESFLAEVNKALEKESAR